MKISNKYKWLIGVAFFIALVYGVPAVFDVSYRQISALFMFVGVVLFFVFPVWLSKKIERNREAKRMRDEEQGDGRIERTTEASSRGSRE